MNKKVKCCVCGIDCYGKISLELDIEFSSGNRRVKSFKNICYFCSNVHMYMWEIKEHGKFYGSMREIVNHLINLHGCNVENLEKALNNINGKLLYRG